MQDETGAVTMMHQNSPIHSLLAFRSISHDCLQSPMAQPAHLPEVVLAGDFAGPSYSLMFNIDVAQHNFYPTTTAENSKRIFAPQAEEMKMRK